MTKKCQGLKMRVGKKGGMFKCSNLIRDYRYADEQVG